MKAEQISKVLAEIQASVPPALRKNLFSETLQYPTLKFLLEKLLEKPDLHPDKRMKAELLLKTEATKKMVVTNKKVAAMIDQFVGRKIKQAIKAGKLPPQSEIKNVDFIKELEKYVSNNEKTTN